MLTLEIQVPDNKTQQVTNFLNDLGISVKVKKQNKIPNAETIEAMEELKAGKGKRFKNVDDLFNSI